MSRSSSAPQILSIENASSRYESTWMATHRVLWLNGMRLTYLVGQIRKQEKRLLRPRAYSVELAIEQSNGPFSQLAESFQQKKSVPQGWHQAVRFCPECLRNGFHSKYFQIPYIENCPLHGQKLRETCEACGGRIGEFAINLQGWPKKPLTCYSCNKSFFLRSLMVKNVIDGYPEAERVFDKVERLYRKIFDVEIVSDPVARRDDPLTPRFEWEGRLFISNTADSPLLTTTRDWNFSSYESKQSFSTANHEAREKSYIPLDCALARVRTAMQILRAIDKQISHRVWRICGHRAPELMRSLDKYSRITGVQREFQFEAHHCPCCATLQWWRNQVGLVFGFYRHCQQQKKGGWSGWQWSYISHLLSLDGQCLSVSSWWLFAYMAQKMSDLIPKVNEPRSDVKNLSEQMAKEQFFRDEAAYAANRHGHIKLKLEEAAIPKLYIQALVDDRFLAVGPSVKTALEKLRRCDEFRRQGPLWKNSSTALKGYIARDKWCDRTVERRNQNHWHGHKDDV